MKSIKLLLAALLVALAVPSVHAKAPNLASVLADPTRPKDDIARDEARKPAEMLAFAGVKPGMTVIDLFPGAGYYTRLLSIVAGPTGKIIADVPEEEAVRMSKELTRMLAVVAEPGRGNVTLIHEPLLKPWPKASIDLFWTSLNYHDIGDMGADPVAFNKLVYDGLKPGGVFIVIDHVAATGSGRRDTKPLHRIEPSVVRREVEAAGFVLDGKSQALANPADDHTLRVFDPAIRGRTDQFAYRFRKPITKVGHRRW